MANYYLKSSFQQEGQHLGPKKSTVDLLLNYSRTLRVEEYNSMKFESFLN